MRILIACAVVVTLAFGLSSEARADEIVFDFSGASEFSGSGAPNLIGTVTVKIEDTATGNVEVKIAASGLNGDFKQLYLNIDPYPTVGGFYSSGFGPVSEFDSDGNYTVEADKDAFKADGDGYFDMLIDFAAGTSNGDWSFLLGVPSVSDFLAYSAPGGGSSPGPFLAAIHVGDVSGANTDSGWYAPTKLNGEPIPEPGTLALIGAGALGLFLTRRRRQRS